TMFRDAWRAILMRGTKFVTKCRSRLEFPGGAVEWVTAEIYCRRAAGAGNATRIGLRAGLNE
ncbi:MAG TPA: hypothetical protein VK001_03240, partial [Geminicoccaceae bacterium]|nr:hypothetical protein [Geminicoccaceae bacterium]